MKRRKKVSIAFITTKVIIYTIIYAHAGSTNVFLSITGDSFTTLAH